MNFLWNYRTVLLAALLGGFFAVACVRSSLPTAPDERIAFADLFRFPGRIERLRRSRWQWFAMVALLLVVRLQGALPLVIEGIVALEFVVFVALPARAPKGVDAQRRGHAAAVGRR